MLGETEDQKNLELAVAEFLDTDFNKEFPEFGEKRGQPRPGEGEDEDEGPEKEKEKKKIKKIKKLRQIAKGKAIQSLQKLQVYVRDSQQQRSSLMTQVDEHFLKCVQALQRRQTAVKAEVDSVYATAFAKCLKQVHAWTASCSLLSSPPSLSPFLPLSLAQGVKIRKRPRKESRKELRPKKRGAKGKKKEQEKREKKEEQELESELRLEFEDMPEKICLAFEISQKQLDNFSKCGKLSNLAVSPEKSTLEGEGLEQVTCNVETQFQILAFNDEGLPLHTGGHQFRVEFWPQEAKVRFHIVDHGSGAYTVFYTLHTFLPGPQCDISDFSVSVWHQKQRLGSPRFVQVYPVWPLHEEKKKGRKGKGFCSSVAASWHKVLSVEDGVLHCRSRGRGQDEGTGEEKEEEGERLQKGAVHYVSISSDGALFYVLGNRSVRVYDSAECALVRSFRSFRSKTGSYRYVAAGKSCVAVGGERGILLFSPSGTLEMCIPIDATVNGLAMWECENQLLVVQGLRAHLFVYCLKTGVQLPPLFRSSDFPFPSIISGVSTFGANIAICGSSMLKVFTFKEDRFFEIRSFDDPGCSFLDVCLFGATLYAVSRNGLRVFTL